jgi:hypothetical protein
VLNRRGFVALLAVAVFAVSLTASVSRAEKLPEPWLKVSMTEQETAIIHDYYRTHPDQLEASKPHKAKKLPPGLQKKLARGGQLPPGWQKKVARGEVMDTAVYAQTKPIPVELVKQLPPQPDGTIIVTVEGKLVRLIEATRTILDVFEIH